MQRHGYHTHRLILSNNRAKARQAFIQRQEQGLSLSDRVWQYTDQFKGEIELGIDCGLRDGLDAPAMARRLQQYLQHPDKLFRRVRDEHGNLRLSQRAAAFHPGRGVYRSSYKNARRLAATETNIAYRTADHERWQQLDFIVGIEVQLSNNHTCKGVKGVFLDICDELQGQYPKEFMFTGWHPHCRCIATTILKTKEEMDADDEAILRGEEPTEPDTSVNAVTELPDNFRSWFEDNQDRIERANSLPYFLRDNEIIVEEKKGANQLKVVSDKAKKEKIEYLEVKPHTTQPDEATIIGTISGGDLTGGSCSSLAFAFIGNRGGLYVTDFRGGASEDFFSTTSNLVEIARSVGGRV